MNQKWEDFKNKYLQNKAVLNKKIFLKENCGDSASPMSMTPLEQPPVAGDLTHMTPEEAYNSGYDAAVSEMMEVISQMMSGEVPVDMAVPETFADLNQLEEGD